LGLSKKHYSKAYESLRGGLDFTKDDENVNSQSFMCRRDRFLLCVEAIYKAQAEIGKIKKHYLNATACARNDQTSYLPHMLIFIDRKKIHDMYYHVVVKALCMSVGDHIYSCTLIGKLEGEREMTLGFVDLSRDDFIE